MIRHAVPYAAVSAACPCPVQDCGGIIPASDCPDHGSCKEPAMEWHAADGPRCLALRPLPEGRYRCASGHLLPLSFVPVGDPDGWDDTCRCKPRP
jgi:hypothetical protein